MRFIVFPKTSPPDHPPFDFRSDELLVNLEHIAAFDSQRLELSNGNRYVLEPGEGDALVKLLSDPALAMFCPLVINKEPGNATVKP